MVYLGCTLVYICFIIITFNRYITMLNLLVIKDLWLIVVVEAGSVHFKMLKPDLYKFSWYCSYSVYNLLQPKAHINTWWTANSTICDATYRPPNLPVKNHNIPDSSKSVNITSTVFSIFIFKGIYAWFYSKLTASINSLYLGKSSSKNHQSGK